MGLDSFLRPAIISFSNNMVIKSVRIFNSLGQVVQKINDINNNNFQFDRNGLNNGQYYFEITSNHEETVWKKLMIE